MAAVFEDLRERAKNTVLVLDRFHIMVPLNKALDEVRAAEARRLKRDGYEPILKHSCWCLLKRPENLTDKQTVKLSELLKYNLQFVRGYLLREDPSGSGSIALPPGLGSFCVNGAAAAPKARSPRVLSRISTTKSEAASGGWPTRRKRTANKNRSRVPKPYAAAYAETGGFERAVKAQEEAIQIYREEAVVEPELEARLALYRDKKPYRMAQKAN